MGNSKAMTINSTDYQIDIIGKNHDTYTAGGTAPLTFQMHDCYDTKYQMNNNSTNSGGWTSCAMRSTHLPAILALMPAAVQSGIREVNKLTSAGGTSTKIKTTADKLFLLSETEMYSKKQYSTGGEGTKYDYYNGSDRMVKKQNGNAVVWWERSPNAGDTESFCGIGANGYRLYNKAGRQEGVAFAFCF